jgi:hypothetical protein
MKRSLNVTAPLLASAALGLLTACRKPQMQRCVDEQNHVVDDKFCQNLPNSQTNMPSNHGTGFVPYHFYYGGIGGYDLGSTVSGGSYIAAPGVSYTTRGGFGGTSGESSGHGAASGGGGE